MLEVLKKLFPQGEIKQEDIERYKKARGLYIEDPWERVKTIFKLDDFKNFHPELLRAIQAAQFGLIFGAGIGAVQESVRQTREFVRTNDTNVYMSKNQMYKIMTNRSLKAMGKGGFKWGPKIGLFTGGFTLMASCCEAYRNKSGIIEYVIGGYIAGGISRSAFGIKGFIAGGIIGAALGFVFGALRVGVEKITKVDTLVLKYSQYAYIKHREELLQKLKCSSTVNSTDILMASIHGEHAEDPLNILESKDEEQEIKEKK